MCRRSASSEFNFMPALISGGFSSSERTFTRRNGSLSSSEAMRTANLLWKVREEKNWKKKKIGGGGKKKEEIPKYVLIEAARRNTTPGKLPSIAYAGWW